MKHQTAIFDIDGTLLNSVDFHAEAWRQAFLHFGRDIPFADLRSQIGKGGDQLLPVFLSEREVALVGKVIEKTRGDLFKRDFLPRVKPFLGVRPLFERIRHDGIKIALASSSKQDEVAHYAKLLDIEDLIEAGTSTDDAKKSKPHPDIFEAALEKLGNPSAKKCVVLGDTPYDAEAAQKAGIKTIGVLCGGFPEEDLKKAGAVAIFRDPEDLLRRYDESPLAE